MKPKTIQIKLNGPQFRAFEALGKRRTLFCGFGRGIGKSWFLRFVWGRLVAEHDGKWRADDIAQRGVRILVLMPTLKQFKDVHWAGLENEFGPGGKWAFLGDKLDRQSGAVTFPGGSWIKPFPASAYNSRTTRGMRCDVLAADEVDDIDPDVYFSVAIPCLSEPWSLGLELIGGTPIRGRHGLWWQMWQLGKLGERLRNGEISEADAMLNDAAKSTREVFENLDPEHWPDSLPRDPTAATIAVLRSNFAFHATYRDAPETVSALAVARAKARTPPATFKREWEADPDAGEGLVYPFDERLHVRQPPPNQHYQTLLVGVDHGDKDPGVIILIGVRGHGNDSEVWVLEEHYQSQRPNSEWNEIACRYRGAVFYADPSRQDRIRDFRGLGLDVRDIPPEVKPIRAGIARVAEMMFRRTQEHGEDYSRFYIAPSCVQTIRELGLYRNRKHADGSISDEPLDKDNHTTDAIRYAIAGHFGAASFSRFVAVGS